ncbi:MAG: ABC transporter ATP-binding protein [Deltaproteobacteria bacterium]|nr:ABC transporter ATP-binding protein [Candidatus Desulfobacula maris]
MSDNNIILRCQGLSKSFGALKAVNNVDLDFESGVVHAIIGPNGAGKTTFINLLSGELQPTEGQIYFKDHDLTNASPNKISQLGIGRSYQKTNIFPKFTCLQNCWIASQSRLKTSMKFFKSAHRDMEVMERAQRALELTHLAMKPEILAANMSYGEQRQLEIAMMLATDPELMLLDEPLAGMGSEEGAEIIELMRDLAKTHTLILIEHDMDAVFAIADQLSVMENGILLETGTVQQIRNSKTVQEAYLGEEETA